MRMQDILTINPLYNETVVLDSYEPVKYWMYQYETLSTQPSGQHCDKPEGGGTEHLWGLIGR